MNELTVMSGNQRVTLQPGQVAHIGRRDDNAVVIDDPRVSRQHIRVSWGPQGAWVLENLGQAGTFVSGQLVNQIYLTQPVEARLAAPDGPAVLFQPAVPATRVAGPVPPAPSPAFAGAGAAGAGAAGAGAGAGAPGAGAGPAAGQPYWGPQHAAQAPYPPGGPAPPPGRRGPGIHSQGIFHTLVPIRRWLKDPTLRQWPKLMVAAYALGPVVLLIFLQNSSDLTTIGWVYSLYIAPLWALVFWWLINPGPVRKLQVLVAAIIIGAEYILIPALTIPWERAAAPPDGSHNLIQWIYGVGLAEEFTKALPVLVLAIFLLNVRHIKLDVRMWMFLATLSGLFFGVYEASTVYVPHDLQAVNSATVFGVPELLERVFVDGLQHALWAGVAGFFIGLGTNYRRRRYLLWAVGLAIPAILHGLNDWSVSGVFGGDMWVWFVIQAFSVFLFIGYASSAHAIEEEVRHTPTFRGDSILMDVSQLRAQQGGGPPGAWPPPGGFQPPPAGGFQPPPGGVQAPPGAR